MNYTPTRQKSSEYLTGGLRRRRVAEKGGLPLDAVMRASSWLSTKNLVRIEEKITEEVALDREGILYAETGLPERRIIEAFGDEISLDDLRKKFTESEINISLGWLRRKKQAILERGIVKIISREKMPDEKLLERIKTEGKVTASELTPELKAGLDLLKKRKEVIKTTEKKPSG